ncbi:hypothetical protein FRX31_029145 [Thalictrum thalictroides]|uniref:Uncharacterized protein n=1 Tax=Thalictrum thalictroides TaxID=46969 RepID=A0A7J6V907_THATH|nr:hypothetical protein FRX31_029145 [Thalictrum thalictroides]
MDVEEDAVEGENNVMPAVTSIVEAAVEQNPIVFVGSPLRATIDQGVAALDSSMEKDAIVVADSQTHAVTPGLSESLGREGRVISPPPVIIAAQSPSSSTSERVMETQLSAGKTAGQKTPTSTGRRDTNSFQVLREADQILEKTNWAVEAEQEEEEWRTVQKKKKVNWKEKARNTAAPRAASSSN